jgi:hypothetical protein
MTKTFGTTARSLLLAGALAFAALPVLAQTAPVTQPAAPAAGSTVTTPATGKTGTSTGKSHLHGKKVTAAQSKSRIHRVSSKKPVETKAQKPATGTSSSAGGTIDTSNINKKP